MVEKEEAAVARDRIEGVDVAVVRKETALAGRRHSRFAVVPANRWRAAIVCGCGCGDVGDGQDASLLQWLVSACSPASIGAVVA